MSDKCDEARKLLDQAAPARSASRSSTPSRRSPPDQPAWRLPPAPVSAVVDREVPELRVNATSPVTLTLSRSARNTIQEELIYSRELLERHDAETGGYLFGHRERDGSFHIAIATRLGSNGRRKPNAVLLDYGEAERMARDLQLAGNHAMRFLWAWHTHPSGSGKPSEGHQRNALDALDWHDLRVAPFTVNLILTQDRERGWSAPIFHPWVTRRLETGLRRAVTEPARLARVG